MTWHLETEWKDEAEVVYRLLEADESGELTLRATFTELVWAKRFKSAILWQEAFGSGLVKLAQDGIIIDTNTGKPWVPPKKTRTPRLKIEPAKKPRGSK